MTVWRLNQTYLSTEGEVAWAQFGDPAGRPVVLLHGTPFSSFVWRNIARALARRHLVYVWDMPGYGLSQKSAGQDLSLSALTRVFIDLLTHWGLTAPLVVAHDTGGAVALGAHLRHGVDYERLALVDAVALPPWGSPFAELAGSHPRAYERLPAKLHTALLQAYLDSASIPGLHPTVLNQLVRPWLSEDGQAAFYRQLTQRRDDQLYTAAMQESYDAIDLPVLLCWGEGDAWVPADRGRELASRVPGARLRIIPDAGHLLHEDGPVELTEALLSFLG